MRALPAPVGAARPQGGTDGDCRLQPGSRTSRGLELLWRAPDVSIELWLRVARGVTRAIYDLINAVIKTVKRFTTRLAKVMGRAIALAVRTADGIEDFIRSHPRLLKALRLAWEVVLEWIGRVLLRLATNR